MKSELQIAYDILIEENNRLRNKINKIKDNERKRILKMFKFELDNQVTSYETLVKLRKLKELK